MLLSHLVVTSYRYGEADGPLDQSWWARGVCGGREGQAGPSLPHLAHSTHEVIFFLNIVVRSGEGGTSRTARLGVPLKVIKVLQDGARPLEVQCDVTNSTTGPLKNETYGRGACLVSVGIR